MSKTLHHQRTALRRAQVRRTQQRLRRPMVAERGESQDWEEGEIAARVRQRLAVL